MTFRLTPKTLQGSAVPNVVEEIFKLLAGYTGRDCQRLIREKARTGSTPPFRRLRRRLATNVLSLPP